MMSRAFVDTNLLIYLVSEDTDKDAAAKTARAKQLLMNGEEFLISVQVLNEFTAACLNKQLVDASSVPGHVQRFCRFFDVAAVGLSEIELAFKVRQRSEDMQDGQVVAIQDTGTLTIVNPLK